MLVVIGIITVLASMLVPSLKRTMRLAASTVCMHNLREIGTGLMLYRVENDGWLPTEFAADEEDEAATASASNDVWFLKLIPTYLSDPMVMTCPQDPLRYRMVEALRGWGTSGLGDVASYGINAWAMTAAGGRLADLDRYGPSRAVDTILVTDLGPDTFRTGAVRPGSGGPPRKGAVVAWDDGWQLGRFPTVEPWVTRRHGHGINMLTVDGGARPARTDEVMRERVRAYYDDCAAGGCSLCTDWAGSSKPFIYHYSFARDRLYWWTGRIKVDLK
ncbi:MAG: hypothetical protein KJ749_11090 [Planctomycetes bacterium]|nr:hypothetical protein [Planctomycetota bacterium]